MFEIMPHPDLYYMGGDWLTLRLVDSSCVGMTKENNWRT